MQLASILSPLSGQRECYMQITDTMPGAEPHIGIQSQDEMYVMIEYFTEGTPANSDDGQCVESAFLQTKWKVNRIMCRVTEITTRIRNHDYTATELQCQSIINMMEQ